MGSALCDACNIRRSTVYCKTHLAKLCLQCDEKLHIVTDDNHDHSRFLLCNNCVSQKAFVQCLTKGFCLCLTCVSNANICSRFLLNKTSNNNLSYIFSPDLDFDSSSSSSLYSFIDRYLSYICSTDLDSSSSSSFSLSSLIDRNFESPFVPLSPKNGDLSPSSVLSQNFDDYTNNHSDQQVQMLHPYCLQNYMDNSYSGFDADAYGTIEENVWLNTFDDDEIIHKEVQVDDLVKPIIETPTEITTVKGNNSEGLVNSSSQVYNNYNNEMIGLNANEETNNIGKFSDATIQFDYGPSQLILTNEMLLWEDQPQQSLGFDPRARYEALQRYFVKKKKRTFGKQIRYESRKSTAGTKKRMKGRFTKAGADYDFDPRANNINENLIKPRLFNKNGQSQFSENVTNI